MLLVGASCSNGDDSDDAGRSTVPSSTFEARSATADEAAPNADASQIDREESAPGSALADLITELPPAPTGMPELEPDPPRPIGLEINSLDIDLATIIGVGIETNGDMEIPPADEVGWYRYGPSPGQQGSAVLAAHIAYEGTDGVFVDLDDLELGSSIIVKYDDGSAAEFVAVSKEQYDKTQLPKDSIFGRSGGPQLVLITCGGDFNREVRSYDDNVVVYANPA